MRAPPDHRGPPQPFGWRDARMAFVYGLVAAALALGLVYELGAILSHHGTELL